jgi:hypothetical protein
MDAGQIFDMLARGRPSIPISEIRFGRSQAAQYAQDKGITNGKLTREQFIEFQNLLISGDAVMPYGAACAGSFRREILHRQRPGRTSLARERSYR